MCNTSEHVGYPAEEFATNRIKIGQGVQEKLRKVFGGKFYPPPGGYERVQ
jgi:hypothetical protein